MSRYLSLPDHNQLRYSVQGTGPLLVVQPPGWGCGSYLYEKTLAELAKDFTVVTYDPRGSGDSLVLSPRTINIGQHVEDLAFLMDYIGVETFHLLGHSHGGWIALLYAAHHTERLEKLVLVCGEMESVDGFDVAQQTYLTSRKQVFPHAVEQMLAAASCSYANFHTDIDFTNWFYGVLPLYAHKANELSLQFSALSMPDFSYQALQVSQQTNAQFPVGEFLCGIDVPTLVINGTSDFTGLRLMAERFVDQLPKVKQAWIENAGHYPWMEQPDNFFPIVKSFLLEEFQEPNSANNDPKGDAPVGSEVDMHV